MALKEVAVQGMTLSYDPGISGGPPSVTGSPSLKVKAETKGVYKDGLSILLPAGLTDAASCVTTAPFPATIPATAIKVKADGTVVLRKDDETATLSIPGLIGGSSPCTLTTKVKVSNAGQTKVKAE